MGILITVYVPYLVLDVFMQELKLKSRSLGKVSCLL